jgi:hypothetical protein
MTARIDPEIEASLLAAKARAEASRAARGVVDQTAEATALQAPQQLTMPWWPDTDRALPADVARSALFSVVKSGQRRTYNEEVVLASWKDTTLRFKGEQFDRLDRDVWVQLLHRFRSQVVKGRATRVYFSKRGLLRDLGLVAAGPSAERLDRSLERLQRSLVIIDTPRYTFRGQLLGPLVKDKDLDRYAVTLHEEVVTLFTPEYGRVGNEQHHKLRGDFTAWLHYYASTHSGTVYNPHRITSTNLLRLAGMPDDGDHRRFAHLLKTSCLPQLQQAGAISDWKLSGKKKEGRSYYVLEFW